MGWLDAEKNILRSVRVRQPHEKHVLLKVQSIFVFTKQISFLIWKETDKEPEMSAAGDRVRV